MNFKQLDIYTESEGIQLLAAFLAELGINGFVMHESADFEEFLNDKNANWDYIDDDLMKLKNEPVYITAYVPDDNQGAEIINSVKGVLNELKNGKTAELFGELKLEIDSVREEDWENNWKQYYKPFQIGNRFIIKPTWEDVNPSDVQLILEIDPASAFGTGQHDTTRLCIEILEDAVSDGVRMLDLGCGSGILSVAGLLLGAKTVTAVDVFENAVNTTIKNIEQNGFNKSKYNVYRGNIAEDKSLREKIGSGYGIITANIVADVIISMCGFFGEFLAENGMIILSGIINERLDEVIKAAEINGFIIETVKESGGWNALVIKY